MLIHDKNLITKKLYREICPNMFKETHGQWLEKNIISVRKYDVSLKKQSLSETENVHSVTSLVDTNIT